MAVFELTNGKITVAFTTTGGTITSIKDNDDLEYLWQGNPEYWSSQAPVLFPICGSIRDDKAVTRNGSKLAMGRHGFVRKLEFEQVEKTENSITFLNKSDEESLKKYPFEYKLYTKYELMDKTLKISHIIENTGKEDMPFSTGGHPAFNCPLVEGEDYTDYYVEFEKKEKCSIPWLVTETGLIDITKRTPYFDNENVVELKHELFHRDAICFDEIESRSVKLLSKKSDKGLKIDFEGFPYLILWSTANDGPFIAIEPWIGLSTCDDESDVFEEKRNTQIAAPGEKKEYSYYVSVL